MVGGDIVTNPYEEFQKQRMAQLVRDSTPKQLEEGTPKMLNATDRCDACGAQAYVSATIKGVDLLFCAHHFNHSEAMIREASEFIHDERYVLADLESRNRHQGEA